MHTWDTVSVKDEPFASEELMAKHMAIIDAKLATKATKARLDEIKAQLETKVKKVDFDRFKYNMIEASLVWTLKMADLQSLERQAKVALTVDSEMFATSAIVQVSAGDWHPGHPLFDRLQASGETFEDKPCLKLQVWDAGNALGQSPAVVWKTALPSLLNGEGMFENSNLREFATPLPNMTDGHNMFKGCRMLLAWNGDMPSLMRAESMFEGCSSMTSFTGILPSLRDGTAMFREAALTSFDSELPMLETAEHMFQGCDLDLASVNRIADTIRDASGDSERPLITIGTNVDMTEPLKVFAAKGWLVTIDHPVA